MGFDYEDEAARRRENWPLSAEASDGLGPRSEMRHSLNQVGRQKKELSAEITWTTKFAEKRGGD